MTDFPSALAEVLRNSKSVRPTPAGLTGHDVAVYQSDDALVESVADFLCDGIRVGQPIIVIATRAHRAAMLMKLRSRGCDPDELLAGRVAVWLDARETLDSFMEGDLPSRELFMATVGSVFERLLDKRNYLIVRAFGEMVDILWKGGNKEGALALEQLWNGLANRYKYSLLCAYSVDNFLNETGSEEFRLPGGRPQKRGLARSARGRQDCRQGDDVAAAFVAATFRFGSTHPGRTKWQV